MPRKKPTTTRKICSRNCMRSSNWNFRNFITIARLSKICRASVSRKLPNDLRESVFFFFFFFPFAFVVVAVLRTKMWYKTRSVDQKFNGDITCKCGWCAYESVCVYVQYIVGANNRMCSTRHTNLTQLHSNIQLFVVVVCDWCVVSNSISA